MSKIRMKLSQVGMITPIILVVLTVFFVFATSTMSWALKERKNVMTKARETKALQVAEAGVDYYKWHLAHAEADYKNGNTWCCDKDNVPARTVAYCIDTYDSCGPYINEYKDYNGNVIGEYSLKITPPGLGSTIVQVESTGKVYEDSGIEKTLSARLGKKSWGRYSFLTNEGIWIGDTESTVGPVHSNGGVRYDGNCNGGVIYSGAWNYNASLNHDGPINADGIWGVDGITCPNYDFAVPTKDFSLVTPAMTDIKNKSDLPGGLHLPYTGGSGFKGYHLEFKNDGTIKIDVVKTAGNQVLYYKDNWTSAWDWEGIATTRSYQSGTFNMPTNGIIFAEDNVWVDGTVKGKVTVLAAKPTGSPGDFARILINNNLQYLARDGSSVMGLMAEGDILVPRHAPNTITIDAVMLSQKGHVFRRAYSYTTSPFYNYAKIQTSITVYGGVITDKFWTWSWIYDGNVVDGYVNTSTIYDNHLTFGPPPSFPTEDNFEVISWSEK